MIALLASALLAAFERGAAAAAKPDAEYATTTSQQARGEGSAPSRAKGGDEAMLEELDLLENMELLENLELFEPPRREPGSDRP